MKSSILRTGMALACAMSLAACGGGNTGTLYLAGSVSGVVRDGLVLQNNGGADLAVPAGAANFQFKELVPSDSIYNVTVKSIPDNVEKCTVVYGSGNTGLYNVTRVEVNCIIKTHALTGTVVGLGDATGLVLVNGANQVPVTANGGNVAFTMAPVSENYPYGITVLKQPAGKTCTVTNGIGTMGTADITTINVACTPATGA